MGGEGGGGSLTCAVHCTHVHYLEGFDCNCDWLLVWAGQDSLVDIPEFPWNATSKIHNSVLSTVTTNDYQKMRGEKEREEKRREEKRKRREEKTGEERRGEERRGEERRGEERRGEERGGEGRGGEGRGGEGRGGEGRGREGRGGEGRELPTKHQNKTGQYKNHERRRGTEQSP